MYSTTVLELAVEKYSTIYSLVKFSELIMSCISKQPEPIPANHNKRKKLYGSGCYSHVRY